MRSGIKCKASELVRDGRIPSLLVLPEWADPPQPQERPYVPNDVEGKAPFDISPDVTPVVPPVLAAEASEEELAVVLQWSAAEFTAGPRIEDYDVYRSDGGAFTLLDTIVLEYDAFGAVVGPALEYVDTVVAADVEYTYKVVAHTGSGQSVASNTASATPVEPPPPTFMTGLEFIGLGGPTFAAPAAWGFGSSDFSCEFWFNDPGAGLVDNEQFRVLRARTPSGAQSGWEVQVRTSTVTEKIIRVILRPSSSDFTFNSVAFTVADNEWHHYAFTVNRTTQLIQFYFDGTPIGPAQSIAAVSGALGIASAATRVLNDIAGRVDELRVWTVERSAAEIAANYTLPFELPYANPNLIADFQFNEGSGTDSTEGVSGVVFSVTGASFVAGPTP